MKKIFPRVAGLFLAFGIGLGVSAQNKTFTNPVYNYDSPDPSIQRAQDGTFYCYATTDGYGRGLETSGPPTVWKSHDFVHWSFEGNYFPSAAEQKYWAPSKAIAANGKWYIYPTINGHMYAAEADSPEGPFRLVRGDDKFVLPYSEESTLLQGADRYGIDLQAALDRVEQHNRERGRYA